MTANKEVSIPRRTPRVFLSFAQADKKIADRVAHALSDAGLDVWNSFWGLQSGESVASRIDQAMRSSDFLLVLLSPSAIASNWVRNELDAGLSLELKDRAITVLPALIQDCEIPTFLADRKYIDLRDASSESMKRLVEQIGTAPTLDFSQLTSAAFEKLVGELLTRLNFSVQRAALIRDTGFDLVASYTYRDPFGAEQTDTWLVETKLYRDRRVDLSTVRQMLGVVMSSGSSTKGLIVTNSRLSSVVREFISRQTRELRVIDGTELSSLLIQYPDIVRAHFPSQP